MKHKLSGMLLAATLPFFAACGASPGAGRTTSVVTATPTTIGANCQHVNMQAAVPGAGYLVPSTYTIPEGAMITVTNQSMVVMEVYLGTNQQFHANPNGPLALNSAGGVKVYPNDSYGVTFGGPGTFALTATCSEPMPEMNMTVTVTGG